jgi:thiamine biosynthesis lipoprotein
MSEHDVVFHSMGSEARLIVDTPARAAWARRFLERFEVALSRFRPDSELCRLNADPRDAPEASPLLRAAARAGIWAAERTGGLVDPTLTGALETAGYAGDRRTPELTLAEALALAPDRAPAAPDPATRWCRLQVDEERGVVRRPPGLRLDTGGTGKGLAADMLAAWLAPAPRWAVDCGGDLRVRAPAGAPFAIDVRHPLTGEPIQRLSLSGGAVATSGIDVRLWRRPDGRPAHHLLDPATGEPAWTGLVGATALAPSALEAEALAKAALLSGPGGAGRWLSAHGGLAVRDDGEVVPFGPLSPRRLIRMPKARAA